MQPISDPRLVVDQILMAERVLWGMTHGRIAMQPQAYQELSRWATESFRSMDTAALRCLRDAAPVELRGIIENVLHERRRQMWAHDDVVGLSSLSVCLALLRRCRLRVDDCGG